VILIYLIGWKAPYQVVVAVVAGLDGTRRIPTILALQQTAEASLCIDIPREFFFYDPLSVKPRIPTQGKH